MTAFIQTSKKEWQTWGGEPVKSFPVQIRDCPGTVPYPVAEKAYEEYARQHGSRQSLSRLAERGGFGVSELIILLYERIQGLEGRVKHLEDECDRLEAERLDACNQRNIAITEMEDLKEADLWEARAKALLGVLQAATVFVENVTILDRQGRVYVERDACDKLEAEVKKYLTLCNPVEENQPMFHIVSLERSRSEGSAVFWYPNGAGYTRDFGEAGLFSQEECDRVKHNKDLLFIPQGRLSENDTVSIIPFIRIKDRFSVV